jgi:hypothetical protein
MEYRHRQKWLAEIDLESAGFRIASSEDASYGVVWSCHIALSPAGKAELTFAPRSWARADTVDADGVQRCPLSGFKQT